MNDSLRSLSAARAASPDEIAASRRAILLAASQRKRRGVRAAHLAALFVLVAPAAWAATSLLSPIRSPAPVEVVPRPIGPAPNPTVVTAPTLPLPPPIAEPGTAPIESAPPAPIESAKAVMVAKAAPPVPSKASSSIELETIERAHRAHHHEGAPASALALYDGYLKQFPKGEFVPEARFGRAVTLEKLGRTAEARAAYEPFARGDYGTYRRAEAREKLRSLSD